MTMENKSSSIHVVNPLKMYLIWWYYNKYPSAKMNDSELNFNESTLMVCTIRNTGQNVSFEIKQKRPWSCMRDETHAWHGIVKNRNIVIL